MPRPALRNNLRSTSVVHSRLSVNVSDKSRRPQNRLFNYLGVIIYTIKEPIIWEISFNYFPLRSERVAPF